MLKIVFDESNELEIVAGSHVYYKIGDDEGTFKDWNSLTKDEQDEYTLKIKAIKNIIL